MRSFVKNSSSMVRIISSATMAGILFGILDSLYVIMKMQSDVSLKQEASIVFLFILLGPVFWFPMTFVLSILTIIYQKSILVLQQDKLVPDDLTFFKNSKQEEKFATLLATLLLLLVALGVGTYFSSKIALRKLPNETYVRLLMSLMGVAITGFLSIVAVPIFYWMSRRCLKIVPYPRTLFIILVGFLISSVAIIKIAWNLEWRVIRYEPWLCVLLEVVLFLIFYRISARWNWYWLMGSFIMAGLLFLGFLGVGFSLKLETKNRFIEHKLVAGRVLEKISSFFDRDHDTYSRYFGGMDCNDHDATIHPGAYDVPQDGVDQDCDGHDAVLEKTKEVESPTYLQLSSPPKKYPIFKGNLLLISIDSLRADFVNKENTPAIFSVAQKAAWFTNAYAQAPNTPRSFPSFLTSKYPSSVQFVDKKADFSAIRPDEVTLFKELAKAHYATIGVFSHVYFNRLYPQSSALSQGFSVWNNEGAKANFMESNTDISSERIAKAAIGQLKQVVKDYHEQQKPFAMWVHFTDPHGRYMAHEKYPVLQQGLRGIEKWKALYQQEVRYTDEYVGMLLNALQDLKIADDTLVVIFADHGEAFGEHSVDGEEEMFHGHSLYEPILRVPLIFYHPKASTQKITDPVMLIDVAPTLLAALGISIPNAFQGQDKSNLLWGDPLVPRPVFAEMLFCNEYPHEQRVVISPDGYKLYDKEGQQSFYDLKQDPLEKGKPQVSSFIKQNLVHLLYEHRQKNF